VELCNRQVARRHVLDTTDDIDRERAIIAKIRADLPPEAFVNHPLRALLAIPLIGMIVAGSIMLVLLPLPWYVALFGSLLIGNLYGSLMFLGHEIGHGATVRSRRLQDLFLYLAGAIFCLSPHLWRVWHHQTHHAHTNIARRDPDHFGTLEEFYHLPRLGQFAFKLAPGSGHWLSALYLFCFFTVQSQEVLWLSSRTMPGFERLQPKRAILDSACLATFWIVICLLAGARGAFFVVILPMLMANFVTLSYIVTNHMLRPLTETHDTLGTTMSVTTHKIFDVMHFQFSHHVEHHLFPAMSSVYYPLVRQSLRRHAGESYMSPPHLWALYVLFKTPRVYADAQTLIEPYSGRKVQVAEVESLLTEGLR
jgi:fatty acid desaturase